MATSSKGTSKNLKLASFRPFDKLGAGRTSSEPESILAFATATWTPASAGMTSEIPVIRDPRKRKATMRAIGRLARSRGFTLIELMIVVAIIAILAAIAYPSYMNYVVKTRRNAATACLSEYANYMERYYTTNVRYDQDISGNANDLTKVTLDCAATSQTGTYYSYSFAANPALSQSAFEILATPVVGSAQAARDTQCGVLGINQSGQRFYQTTKTDSAGLAACWEH